MLDYAGWLPVLKQLYPNGLKELLYEYSPLYGTIKKSTDFEGEAWAIVPMYSGTMGSTVFKDAQAHKEDVSVQKFLITRKRDYAVASVESETMLASRSNKGAIAKSIDSQVRGAMYQIKRSLGFQLFGAGTGVRGVGNGSWTVTGNTVTLSDPNDIVHFEKNMVYNMVNAALTLLRTGTIKVASVNRKAGSFTTVEANISVAIPGALNTDVFVRVGDFNNCVAGLDAWLPYSDPVPNLFGVTRTEDRVRLAGLPFDGEGRLEEEVIIDACAEGQVNGAMYDTLILHPKRFANLVKSAYSKTLIDVETDIPGIGYKALEFPTPSGTVKCLSDHNCKTNDFYLLTMDTWEWKSLGECPHFAQDDGNKYQREATEDGLEFRIRSYHNLGCYEPGMNLHGKWKA